MRRHTAALSIVLGCALSAVSPVRAVPLVAVSFSGSEGAVLYDVSPLSGQAGVARSLGVDRLVGAAATAGGTVYGLTASTAPVNPASLFTIDATTGAAQLIGSTGLLSIAEGDIAIDPTTGLLYGGYSITSGRRQLFTINPASGQAALLPGDVYGDSSAMAFDSAGNLFVLDSSLSKLYGVNKQTGGVASITSLSTTLGAWAGMAVDPGSGTFYVADGGTGGTGLLYTLDPGSGVLTSVGPTGLSGGLAGLTFLPEPATFFLCTLPAAWLLGRRRR